MTFSIAWKNQDSIFLAADSALTYQDFGDPNDATYYSSFGEKQVLRDEIQVLETGLKIFNLEKMAITFAGDYDLARVIAEDLYCELKNKNISEDLDFKKIIENELDFRCEKIERNGYQTEFIFANFENEIPIISTYINGEFQYNVEGPILLGSISSEYKSLFKKYLTCKHSSKGSCEKVLSTALAILQSFGMYDDLFKNNVGGAFCGGYITSKGFKWQPDLIYALFEGDDLTQGFFKVNTLVREDCFLVATTFRQDENKLFTYDLDETKAQTKLRANLASELGVEAVNSCLYDYSILINRNERAVFVIHMKKEMCHGLFQISKINENQSTYNFDGKLTYYVKKSKKKIAPIDLPLTLYFPFQKPPLFDLPERLIR